MKKWSLIGSIIFAIGAIIFISSFSALGWDINKLSTMPPYEEKNLTIDNLNQDIKVDDKNVSIYIENSVDDKIHFTYYENEKESYIITQTQKVQFIKNYNYKWYDNFFNVNFQIPSIKIAFPTAYNGNINIKTENNKVIAKNITASNLSIITSNGAVSLSNVNANGNANIKTSNGEIKLESFNVSGNIDLKTSNNDITGTLVGEIDDFSINSATSNGKNNLSNSNTGKRLLNVKTSNGKIGIYFE